MKCHQTEQSNKGRSVGGIVISQRAFTAFLFWVCEILQDFAVPKQALRTPHYLKLRGPRSKRFLLCLLPFAADVQTSPAQVHGAKVLHFSKFCK